MQLRLAALSFLISFTVVELSGCGPKTSNNQGIEITTAECDGLASALPYNVCKPGPHRKLPHIPISGIKTKDYYDAFNDDLTRGSVGDFGFAVYGDAYVYTDKDGNAFIPNAKAPAAWNIDYLMPYNCGTTNYIGQLNFDQVNWWEYQLTDYPAQNYASIQDNTIDGVCVQYGALPAASTRFAIVGSFPNSITLSSEATLTTSSGMPLLYVYDKTATVIATETATSVNSGGTQATFPFPSSLAESGYSLAIVNQTNSSTGYSPAGTNLLSIASSQTIAGNPFGVAAASETINIETLTSCTGETPPPNAIGFMAFPVTSLYSTNQVMIGSATVTVGSNPTAVVAYTSDPVQVHLVDFRHCINEVDTYSGTTRAIVANSGSNSISILDLVNAALLSNVTVGNRPVALAVSSDGSTAYVANYADSTVTQVNLSAGTATNTVAVGGQPTSVALTAAGILWVGGAGFLTEINTQTMSVVATQTAVNKTIVALGYSDSVNELIATSADTSGNVLVEEISPSTVQTGTLYSPASSHAVSSLGTYQNQSTGTQVQAFSNTLANTSSISAIQVGAPPLVVQDGWAVVSATPTGFTITDASGHIVLVSETTPSPITAIAVDTKLNVAYLTMPDSNTLLMVPLPGTGN